LTSEVVLPDVTQLSSFNQYYHVMSSFNQYHHVILMMWWRVIAVKSPVSCNLVWDRNI